MPVSSVIVRSGQIPPRSGVGFTVAAGQYLVVVDPRGEQVADLVAFAASDMDEVLSSGRTLDYESRIFLTTGNRLWSNRSRVMLDIVADSVGRHDFLLTPCSADTFRIIYGDTDPHRGCFGNLAEALAPFGILPDRIPVAFNCFMNVTVDGESGELAVLPPRSRAGDTIMFRARMDLIVGLTACSAPQSNNHSFKPIDWRVHAGSG
ncbi:MAG: hypothetical protein RIS17_757 [Pseudomonadota bacterium]